MALMLENVVDGHRERDRTPMLREGAAGMADITPNPVGLPLAPSLTSNAHHINATGATLNDVRGDQHNYQITLSSLNSLSTLPYAEGASWNPRLACLPDTRTALFHDIWKWINEANRTKTAEIFFLSDVAGSGKSAIAHTVARDCHQKGLLASSFFFDRDIPDRSRPQKLFSTIVRDLSRLQKDLAENINVILENDPSLASASQSRQFDELILKPFQVYKRHIDRPIVIVIDALDEGYDLETLEILGNKVPDLPGTFRIFVTSRPTDDILMELSSANHVQCRSIDIHGDSNQKDIALYIQERLRYIASRKRLGADWPDAQLRRDFIVKAEGLFIWASTVSNYLSTAIYPERKLRRLLYENDRSGLNAEEKMDECYAEILNTCDWRDGDFVEGYHLVIGAVVAVKTPLSISVLQCLHWDKPTLKVDEVLRPLSSVLTGLDDDNRPIQLLHLSLRDFLTCRAQTSPAHERFYVSEKEHSGRLAFLCLQVMNEQLKPETPGTGYLTGQMLEMEGIPRIEVSEVLWYACRFWAEHIIEIEGPLTEMFLESVRIFWSKQLLIWMEVLHSKFEFQSLLKVRTWLQRTCSTLVTFASDVEQAKALFELSARFRYTGRREDALKAIEEAVKLFRGVFPATFNPCLAVSLNNLSHCLCDLGRQEDAMKAIEEGVEVLRRLAANHPATFNPELATSLDNLSVCLSNLGRREDAMKAIEEAVELWRRLAADHPATFNPDLAISLSNLSNRLSGLGRLEDATKAAKEAVKLCRVLAADHPATFNPNLAISLNNLSGRLSYLGQREDAMKAIEEAVELQRWLAAHHHDHPATFNPDLAMFLHNLSVHLAEMGRREDAMKSIEEAVKLYRGLAADYPAAFNPGLVTSLNTLSVRLTDLGEQEDAMKTIEEAVELCRGLADDHPATFNPDLAMSLGNLSYCLSKLGRREDAMKAIKQAVKLYRGLAADHPATFNPDLHRSLINLSFCLSDLGRREDAMKAFTEAVEPFQVLATDHPATLNQDFFVSLNNLLYRLFGKQAVEEAVELYQGLTADHTATFDPDLATSLNNLSLLSNLG